MAICSTSRPCAKKKEVETREEDHGSIHGASRLGTPKWGPISRLFPQILGQLLRGEKMVIDGWMCSELGSVLAKGTWEEDALMHPARAGGT